MTEDREELPNRRSWLPHPAYLTLGAIVIAAAGGVLWYFLPFIRSARLAAEIEAHGGRTETRVSTPEWIREHIPAEVRPDLSLIRGAELRESVANDEILAKLARERELLTLVVRGHEITDAGIDNFRRHSALRSLLLIDCPGVSPQMLEILRKEQPKLTILLRGPAFLGVEGHDDPDGCVLRTVQNGSPASLVGLRAGDVITHFGDTRIRNYDALVKAIAQKHPGDAVEISYLRDESKKTARPVLAPWN